MNTRINQTAAWYPPTRRALFRRFCICASLATLSLNSAHATTEGQLEGDTLGEIVVTAQKREQNLQNVGVSITALQSGDLRKLGIVNTTQLGADVPGLQINSASGGNFGTQVTIRGVANSDYSQHQESPNSMYLDEVYVSAPNEQGANLFDMQRVEVLRGPQGTLFGRNSTGGLVSLITNKPTEQDEGYIDVTYGEFNETRIEAAASGRLADGIEGRLAVASQVNDGYDKNYYYPGQENLNGTDFHGVRAAYRTNLEGLEQGADQVQRDGAVSERQRGTSQFGRHTTPREEIYDDRVKQVSVIEEETYHTACAETDGRHGITASGNRPLQHCSVDGT